MPNREGTPIWYELMTDAPEAAEKFYGNVMGWTFASMPNDVGGDYRIASSNGVTVAGIMRTPDHAKGMPATWLTYIGVVDVDASAKKVKALGGSVDIEPTDIPGVGRFAFCRDPQGASFYIMRGDSSEDSRSFAPATPGHCSWNELVTSDQKAALDFYSKLFGWEHGGAMPMGEMGDYTFINCGGDMIGAVMNAQQKDTRPYWNFAFEVADIDSAKQAVETGGGKVRSGPMELPEDSGWMIQTDDPHGAKIMFTGPRKA